MKADRILLILVIFMLLGLGMLMARILSPERQTVERLLGQELWRARRLDLMVQIVLVFVGALGIRALLPEEDEME